MKITRATDYAIRLLAHLAAGEVETTSATLADELGIPLNHLAKLVQTLSRHGLLSTRRGKGGGLKLAIAPKKIKLAQIIELVDGPIMVNDCLMDHKSCAFSNKCKTRKCLTNLRSQIYKLLESTTLSDLALQY